MFQHVDCHNDPYLLVSRNIYRSGSEPIFETLFNAAKHLSSLKYAGAVAVIVAAILAVPTLSNAEPNALLLYLVAAFAFMFLMRIFHVAAESGSAPVQVPAVILIYVVTLCFSVFAILLTSHAFGGPPKCVPFLNSGCDGVDRVVPSTEPSTEMSNFDWALQFTSICSGGFPDPSHQTSSVSGIEMGCSGELSCTISYEYLVVDSGQAAKETTSVTFDPRGVSFVGSDRTPTQIGLECRNGETDCLTIAGNESLLWKNEFPSAGQNVALRFSNDVCTARFVGFLQSKLR